MQKVTEEKMTYPIRGPVPYTLRKTLILVEDKRFYYHFGIDLLATARAVLVNLSEMRYAQGGSTITQQLARTLYLHRRKTLARKIAELFIAFWLELRMTKVEILAMYMDRVYMGQRIDGTTIRGFHEASVYYFGVSLGCTNSVQQAHLVGMLKGPNIYKPFSELGSKRRDEVLNLMERARIT